MVFRRRRVAVWMSLLLVTFFTMSKLKKTLVKSDKPVTYQEIASDAESEELASDWENGIFPLPKRRTFGITKPKDSVIPDMFYRHQPDISPHDFKLLLNPRDICRHGTDVDIHLAVMIASASWEFERRAIIRRTWAAIERIHGKRVIFLFFVGNDGNSRNNLELQKEFSKFGDLVQEDFKETYRNLTLKTQGQLKWATYFCPTARLFMHIDDDVVPDISNIVKQHTDEEKYARSISCAKVFKPRVRRDGKWITSKEEYPGDQYPLSCVGWCFIMTRDVAHDLYYMSLDTSLLHLEDVAVTGILREKVGNIEITKMSGGESMCQHKGWPKDRPTNEKIVQAWREIHEEGDGLGSLH